MVNLKTSLACVLLGFAASTANAVTLSGVTVTADSFFALDANSDPANLTNNTGLSAPKNPSATHIASPVGQGGWITALGVPGNTNVTFNLGGAYDLSTIHIWQHNQANASFTGPAGAANGDLRFRGVNQFDVLVSSDGVNFTQVLSNQSLAITPSTGNAPLTVSAQNFAVVQSNVTHVRLHIDSNHGDLISGGVVGLSEVKFDANVNVNPNIFNATTNTGGDEPAGLSTNFTFSASIGGDHPMDAFGNNDGVVEGNAFIFSDGGTVDNGNGIFGDGSERVDFIQWQTTSPITLAGYEILLSGDGGGAARATELVRFFVEGVQVDLFDNNASAGGIARLFAGGAVTGDDFRIEFTRTSTTGQRIQEINAILPNVVVPEPASLSLLALGGIALMRRRRTA